MKIQSHFTKRLFLLSVLLLVDLNVKSMGQDNVSGETKDEDKKNPVWNVITVQGSDYVTDQNVANFYQIKRFESDGEKATFMHSKLKMTWVADESSMIINRVKVCFEQPIIEHKGNLMLSTKNLKNIDQIIRPRYHKNRVEKWETVVLDFGKLEAPLNSSRTRYNDLFHLDFCESLKTQLVSSQVKAVQTRTIDGDTSLAGREAAARIQVKPVVIKINLFPLGEGETTEAVATTPLNSEPKLTDGIGLGIAIHSHIIQLAELEDRGVVLGGEANSMEGLSGLTINLFLKEETVGNPNSICKAISKGFLKHRKIYTPDN